MRIVRRFLFLLSVVAAPAAVDAQQITAAGQPAQLDVRMAGQASIRITLTPLSARNRLPDNPAIARRTYPAPVLSLRAVTTSVQRRVGSLTVAVRHNPLTVTVRNAAGEPVQEIVFENDGTLSFELDEHPVLGMGEGGPRPAPGKPWREQPVQFDRRGQFDTMEPRWQSDMYGSRNPVALLCGTAGWGLFVAAPWGQIDLRRTDRGVFLPRKPTDADRAPQTERNQQQALAKGLPPPDAVVPGLYEIFAFDAHDPAKAMKDFSVITGPGAVDNWVWKAFLADLYMRMRRADDARRIIDGFEARRPELSAVTRAALYAAVRERDRAVALLKQACDKRDPDIGFLTSIPAFDILRGDPEFQALLRRTGLS